jgi:hypothetical protein
MSGIQDKEDGLKRLSSMTLHGGVWILRVQLVIGREMVAIVDIATEVSNYMIAMMTFELIFKD